MSKYILYILTIVFMCALIYGMYWIFKTFSYFFFYEDMVQDTIRELVKQAALK